jgi:hypothetical protein
MLELELKTMLELVNLHSVVSLFIIIIQCLGQTKGSYSLELDAK